MAAQKSRVAMIPLLLCNTFAKLPSRLLEMVSTSSYVSIRRPKFNKAIALIAIAKPSPTAFRKHGIAKQPIMLPAIRALLVTSSTSRATVTAYTT